MGEATVSIGFIVIICVGTWIFNSVSCSNRWGESGLPSKFGITTGCMIKYKGAWIPDNRYRATDE